MREETKILCRNKKQPPFQEEVMEECKIDIYLHFRKQTCSKKFDDTSFRYLWTKN